MRILDKRVLLRLSLARRCHQQAVLCPSVPPSASTSGEQLHADRYDPRLKLVEELNIRKSKKERTYESPFFLPRKTEEDYFNLFVEQIALEKGNFTKVKNISRRETALKPMEELIAGMDEGDWEWGANMREALERAIENIISEDLLTYFKRIDLDECARQLVELTFAILCRGQSSIPVADLEPLLSRLLFNLHTKAFYASIGDSSHEDMRDLFREYIRYFTEPRIAGKFTAREWWCKSANKCGQETDFYPLFCEFFNSNKREVSSLLLKVIVDSCEFRLYSHRRERPSIKWSLAFTIREIPIAELNPDENLEHKFDLCKMLCVHDQVIHTYCRRHQFEYLYFPTKLLPMKVPPRPWLDRGKCGPNYLYKQDVIRQQEDYDEMDLNREVLYKRTRDKMQARPVYDALNSLGAIPWMINEEMLGHGLTALEMTYDSSKANFLRELAIARHPSIYQVPTKKEFNNQYKQLVKIRNDEEMEEEVRKLEEKEIKGRLREMYANEKERNEQNSLWCWLLYRLTLANHFRDKVIYFPHNIDFRGRAYPISPQINHMGDDFNRGLLKFAKGKPLGEDGFRWLKLHCINITGKMKRKPLRERLEYAEKHIDQMVDAAERPFGGADWWWKGSEEPWQTLAACIELRDALKSPNPHNFCSHLPIHQDGSCNGLQHYAALGRDLEGAREVNLLPEDTPKDIYSSVVERVNGMRLEDESNEESKYHEIAVELREQIPGPIERKIIKQTVMTTVYGVTSYGARQQIKRQLLAIGIEKQKAAKFSTYLTKCTFKGLTDAFSISMKIMDWFKCCARQILKLRRTVEWVTPLGFPVVQPYVTARWIEGSLAFLPLPHKQKNAFPPNFIHSLDSCHMMLTSLHCHTRGVTFAAVHDCFWTHACDVDLMNEICRHQFIRLHEEPIIQRLSQSFVSTYLTEDLRNEIPEDFLKEIEQTFKITIRPGSLDINEVSKSTYFFS